MQAVVTVIGQDRIGIVYEVSKLLAQEKINIVSISQEIMGEFFTMVLLVDLSKCPKSYQVLSHTLADYGKQIALSIQIQNAAIFEAMHRIG